MSFRILLYVQYTGSVMSTDPPDQHGVSSWWCPVAVLLDSHWDVTADELRGRCLWQHVLVSIWNGVHGADNCRSDTDLESRPSLSGTLHSSGMHTVLSAWDLAMIWAHDFWLRHGQNVHWIPLIHLYVLISMIRYQQKTCQIPKLQWMNKILMIKWIISGGLDTLL